jgi:hypothetical protein
MCGRFEIHSAIEIKNLKGIVLQLYPFQVPDYVIQ